MDILLAKKNVTKRINWGNIPVVEARVRSIPILIICSRESQWRYGWSARLQPQSK